MGHGYARLGPFMGEIIEVKGDVRVLEFRSDIKDWRYTGPGGNKIAPADQPPLYQIARYFEEFWTGGEPLNPSGLYLDRGVAVLHVSFEPGRVQVTVRPLPIGE